MTISYTIRKYFKNLNILNKNNISFIDLSNNTHDKAIELLNINKKYFFNDYFCMCNLYHNSNPKALELLSEYFDYLSLHNNIFIRHRIKQFNFEKICRTPHPKAIEIITKYLVFIIYHPIKIEISMSLCMNPIDEALDLFNELLFSKKITFEKCYLNLLCSNTNDKAIKIVSMYINDLNYECWLNLCSNSNDKAVELVFNYMNNFDKFHWTRFYRNTNNKVIDYIINNFDDKYIDSLCCNTSNKIIDIIINNSNKITIEGWIVLCSNSNSKILNLISLNLNNIYEQYKNTHYICCIWKNLSNNSSYKAFELILNNINNIKSNKFNYNDIINNLSNNPNFKDIELLNIKWCKSMWVYHNIFTYDYDTMKKIRDKLINKQELINKTLIIY